MKFAFPALVAVIMPLAFLVAGQLRKPLLILCVLGLQADYFWFAGDLGDPAWVGSSGSSVIFVGFSSVACLAYLVHDRLMSFGPDRSRFEWARASVTVPTVLMALTAAATIFYSPERLRAIYSLQVPFNLYLFFLVGLNASRSREDFQLVVKCLMAVLLMQSVIYFIQNAVGIGFNLRGELITRGATQFEVQRHGGTVGTTPSVFASFILPLLFIAISRFFLTRDRRERRRMMLLSGIGTFALLLTVTRAAYVGFALGMLWMIVLIARRRGSTSRVGAFIAVTCLAIAILWPVMSMRTGERNVRSAYDTRKALMQTAWRVIEDNPVLGVGAGAYAFVFRQYLTPDVEREWVYVVHNVYLLRWAETGILGILSLLALWLLGLRDAWRATRSADPGTAALAVGWSAGLVALMWEMWWDMNLGFQPEAVVWFLLGMIQAAIRNAPVAAPAARRRLAPPPFGFSRAGTASWQPR
jgi:putative inorganic carbon (hco3(-)) transporter